MNAQSTDNQYMWGNRHYPTKDAYLKAVAHDLVTLWWTRMKSIMARHHISESGAFTFIMDCALMIIQDNNIKSAVSTIILEWREEEARKNGFQDFDVKKPFWDQRISHDELAQAIMAAMERRFIAEVHDDARRNGYRMVQFSSKGIKGFAWGHDKDDQTLEIFGLSPSERDAAIVWVKTKFENEEADRPGGVIA